MAAWKAGFQGSNPDVTVNYDAVGSGGGREQFLAGGVQFAGSDAYLTDDELDAGQGHVRRRRRIEFPVYVSPIAVVYNLDGVDDLQLSPDDAGADLRRQDHQVERRRDRRRQPRRRPAGHRHHAGAPFGRVGHDGELHRLPVAGRPGDDWTYGPVDDLADQERRGRRRHLRRRVCRHRAATAPSATPTRARPATSARPRSRSASEYVGPTAEAASAVLDESKPGRRPRAPPTSRIDVNRTTTAAGVYPIVLVSYQIVCSTYDRQDDGRPGEGLRDLRDQRGRPGRRRRAAPARPRSPTRSATQAQAAIDAIAAK